MHSDDEERRGFSARPVLDRDDRISPSISVRQFVVLILAGIMVFSALAVVVSSVIMNAGESENELPAYIQAGEREVIWTMSNFFESYVKSTDPANLGHHTDTMGLNSWWDVRGGKYGDTVIRDSYPFVMAANPYPDQVTPDVDMGYYMYTPYRVYIEAKNITDVGTAAGKDAVFIPVLEDLGGDPDIDGGEVSFNWYGTYMTQDDLEQLRLSGVDYWAQTYYGVRRANLLSWDDGYVFELHGKITFDRQSAAKYLNLTGAEPLKDQFDAVQADIAYDWFVAWDNDANGRYDIYTGFEDVYYDIHGNIMAHADDNPDPDTLVLRMWHASWGDEVLMTRYLEAAGIAKYWQPWYENWYINGSIGKNMGNFSLRGDAWFQMQAWADPDVDSASWPNNAGWMLEAVHIDYVPNDYYVGSPTHTSYPSPFNPYDPTNGRAESTDALRPSYAPGTTKYGMGVSYWVCPMEMDLEAGEKMVIKLPHNDVIGYKPYRGASDTLNSTKVEELNANSFWGKMVLGDGSYPSNIKDYYDPVTKVLTLEGPIDFPTVLNPDDTRLLMNGIPMFVFNVCNVSEYRIEVLDQSTGDPVTEGWGGIQYDLRVTAVNQSGVTKTGWNGTVNLEASAGATLGSTSHTFVVGDAGVWTTTVTFAAIGDYWINATDSWYPLDVTGSVSPEPFPVTQMLQIPPVAIISAPETAYMHELITFNGSGSYDPDGDIVSWEWDFGDGNTSSGETVTHTYTEAGDYTVNLTVTDDDGLNDSTEHLITIIEDVTPPEADAGADQTVNEGTTVTFNGSGSTDNVGIVNYTWTFDDGDALITLYGVSPTYLFAEPGIYVVTLNVTDAAGNWDEDTVTITVLDITSPVANAGSDQEVTQGATVTFDGSGSTDNVGIVNYTWTFTDDGVTKTLYGVSPTYKFDNPGTYEVTLTVRDAAGNSATDTVTITVEEKAAISSVLLIGVVVVIALIIIVAVYMMMRKGKGGTKSSGGDMETG